MGGGQCPLEDLVVGCGFGHIGHKARYRVNGLLIGEGFVYGF